MDKSLIRLNLGILKGSTMRVSDINEVQLLIDELELLLDDESTEGDK